jgi:outer membrane protein OmpA-like peptidoglycan-associated protein
MPSRTFQSLASLGLASLFVVPALTGCAATTMPTELANARQAYARASVGPARDLVPAELLSAQQALDRAEKSFSESADSDRTRDLAYIAERRAEVAATHGTLAATTAERERSAQELTQLQAARHEETKQKLSETRAELAGERIALANKDQQLADEKHARHAAERQARAALASLQAIAVVKEEQRGTVITLNGAVLFATGQSTLLPIAADRLREVAKALKETPRGAVTVEGHTDSVGSPAANEELSRRRAESVRAFLLTEGVDADRVRAVGLGQSRPIADNKSPEGRANNRRVEIVVSPDAN